MQVMHRIDAGKRFKRQEETTVQPARGFRETHLELRHRKTGISLGTLLEAAWDLEAEDVPRPRDRKGRLEGLSGVFHITTSPLEHREGRVPQQRVDLGGCVTGFQNRRKVVDRFKMLCFNVRPT